MRNSFISKIAYATIIVFILSFTSCADNKKNEKNGSPDPIAATEELKQELTALQYQEDKAESDKDFATLDKIVSKDLTVDMAMDMYKFHIPNRDSFYAILRRTPPDTSAYKKPLYENIKVTTAGDEAVMDYRVTFYGNSQDGESKSDRYHNIVKWIKVDGQWQMVSVQSNSIPRKNE